jgi:hypothetical protein
MAAPEPQRNNPTNPPRKRESTMTIVNNNHVTIDTTSSELTIGQILVSADRRSPKKGPKLPDAQRIRRVILPANHWQELGATLAGSSSQPLTDLLRSALKEVANARLKDTLSSDPMTRTVPLSDYTVGALLAWNNDSAASRGSITYTREEVEQWYPTSKARAAMVAERGEQWAAALGEWFAKTSSKTHGVKDADTADKLIARLADDATIEDDNAALVADLIARLASIAIAMRAKKADPVASMSQADL